MKHYLIFLFTFILIFPILAKDVKSPIIKIPLHLENQLEEKNIFPYCYMEKRPKIAIALSGGGARGLAQIGVFKVFEKYAIPIDGIAGTSIGAVIGGLYSAGYSAAELESLSYQIRWNEMIQDAPPRKQLFLSQKEEKERYIFQFRLRGLHVEIPSAYTAGQRFSNMLAHLIFNAPYSFAEDFDHLRLPFRALATDLYTGKKIVINQGSLIDALRASMAIPLLFTPVEKDGLALVDGGLIQNLPVSEARSLGADLVIAVDTSSELRDARSLKAPWEVADQVTTIMQRDKIESQLKEADLAIIPELTGIANIDFNRVNDIIHAGELATEQVIPLIEQWLTKRDDFGKNIIFQIQKISIIGMKNLNSEYYLSLIGLNPFTQVTQNQITWAGKTLIQTGYFNNVEALLDTSTKHMIFQVEENPIIEKIKFWGNTVFTDSVLLNILEQQPGEILNHLKECRDIQRIEEKYHKAGYSLAKVIDVKIEGNILIIGIDEGYLGKIIFSGIQKTHPFVIRRELPMNPGDLFNVSLLKRGIENIYSTGYFEGVQFEFNRENRYHNLIFRLEEQEYTLFRLGLRYDLERQFQGFVQAVEDNLFGLGAEGSLMGFSGHQDKMVSASIRADRLLTTYLTFKANFSIQRREYAYYENHYQTGTYRQYLVEGSIAIGQQMKRLGMLSVQLRSERTEQRPISGQNAPHAKAYLWNIVIRSEVDTRDRVPFPQSGKYHILEYETSAPFLGSDITYFKIFSSMESYFPLFKQFSFHPKIQWGSSDQTIPFSKQFRLGGLDSFLGLHEQDLIGKRFIVLNNEFRQRLPVFHWLESYISFRYDFGGIWGRYSKLATRDFKQGIGGLLSFNTLFGPVCFGWGSMSDGHHFFYLSAGYRF